MYQMLRGSLRRHISSSLPRHSAQLSKQPGGCLHLQRPALGALHRTSLLSRSFTINAGASAAAKKQANSPSGTQPSWTIEMLYDGDCPLCMREVNSLRKANGQGNINFVDIAASDYSPADHAGISFEEAMGKIHAIRRDGAVLTNVEAFRQLYDAAGRGWVYSFAQVAPLRWLADKVYDVWAKYRLRITGRPDLTTIMDKKRTCK